MKRKVVINNSFQKNYIYYLTKSIGKNFDPDFKPELSPKQMIDLGIFGGKYETVNNQEFPKSWFKKNKLGFGPKDPNKNYFKVTASQSLAIWQEKGWIYKDDPQGWFLWYCRYYMGRRLEKEDQRQIKRWKAFKRHIAQIKKHCKKNDLSCRVKQRQALLHWAYDSRKI